MVDLKASSHQTGDDAITVLLVDDNEQWARFIASDIEAEYPSLTVHIALSPNEAMLRLGELDIDCVVADYQMPEVDGLELLERLRRDHPGLPYILATSEGSEDIASAAIDAGVSDYVVKDPRVDQLSVFASKIQRAVETARLRNEIAESERRYRSLTEQSSDGIIIVQDGTLAFYNQWFVDLTGRDRRWFEPARRLTEIVHPDDQDDVRSVVDHWQENPGGRQLHEVRLVTLNGEVRSCEYTGQRISHDGGQAVMITIRDVTKRKQRQREIRWQRDLNQALNTILVAAQTREEIERGVVDLLADHGYALAWIGVPEDGTLTPRVESSDNNSQTTDPNYLAAVDYSLETGAADSEPSLWAARSGDSRFVTDFEELFSTDWCEKALSSGYRSGAAIPLSYNGISYGVLALYHAEADRFDRTERRLLESLADSVAFGIHTVETERSLASDHTVELTLRVADEAYYLVAIAREIGSADDRTITVHGTLRHANGQLLQYLSVDESTVDALRTALTGRPEISDVETIGAGPTPRLQIIVDAPTPESILIDHGAVVRSTTVDTRGADLVVELPARDAVRTTVESVGAAFVDVSVRSVTEVTYPNTDSTEVSSIDRSELTDKQAAALEVAFHHGYFEKPRGSSATEIAEALDVAHSTFLQHLRAAQQKLFTEFYR